MSNERPGPARLGTVASTPRFKISLKTDPAIRGFRLQLEPDLEAMLLVLHPFALARLTPERIDVHCDRTSASPALNVTAHFYGVSDIQAKTNGL